jgi:hypothetical protein
LETTFPSGEWVVEVVADPPPRRDGQPSPERESVAGVEDSPSRSSARGRPNAGEQGEGVEDVIAPGPSLTIIGGTKYDEDALDENLSWYDGSCEWLIVGDGRGAEKHAIASWMRRVIHVHPRHDVYGKSARKVNVEAVLSYDPSSPLLLVGSGERVKQAEAWLKRANWPREVHRIP